MPVYLARQPIYDRRLEVVGYELLYRRGQENAAGEINEEASAQSLVNALIEFGLSKLVGDKLAFVNLTRDLLVGEYASAFPKERVVLELLEDITPDAEVTKAVATLAQKGYSIALDDFTYKPEFAMLVRLASIIKIDVLSMGRSEIGDHIVWLRRPGVKLLAEKVEDHDTFDLCKEMGFDMFQGYFFCKPEIVEGRGIQPNRVAIVRLLAKLQDPNSSYNEIEELARGDVSLTYRLLRFINSAHMGLSNHVESLRQALQILGTKTVMALASLVAMSGIGDKPQELMVTAMVRAKTCENLAKTAGLRDLDRFFTVGLLSVLDALLDAPMKKIITELPLSPEINDALLNPKSKGELASALRCAVAFERGEFDKAVFADLDMSQIASAYMYATNWSRTVDSALAA